MKLAYIITAYRDPYQLARLIRSLNIDSHFYIHLDSRIDINPFKIAVSEFTNVAFIEKRFFTNWGSFAQVLSQKELLKVVLESGIRFNRVICLSATDYPIWSNNMIKNEFELNQDKEYIQALNLTRCETLSQLKRITLYHFFRDIKINNALIKKIFSGSSRFIMKLSGLRKKKQVMMGSKLVDVYLGSDYWSLTIECAKFVYEKLCTEKKLMDYFKYSFVSSEMCIHTIVFNSKYGKNAIQYPSSKYEGLKNLTPLHYIEYGKAIKIFVEEDYDLLLNSNKIFFRKSATGISDKLLDKIDLKRLS